MFDHFMADTAGSSSLISHRLRHLSGLCKDLQGGPKSSHYQVSSLNRIKNRQ